MIAQRLQVQDLGSCCHNSAAIHPDYGPCPSNLIAPRAAWRPRPESWLCLLHDWPGAGGCSALQWLLQLPEKGTAL